MFSPHVPDTGDVVAGHLIVRRVGEGAVAVVYEALAPDRALVALKVLKPEQAHRPEVLSDFKNEAESTGAVDHENVVEVLGQGEKDGFHYIRMELVDGPHLDRMLRDRGRLPWKTATEIVVLVARALGRAHEKGIVHRDVKPDNILLYPDGRVRLTDFGIAKDISSLKGFLLKGRKVGTAAYASPEQCLGKRLDPATDMYSLGATFFHAVCGRYPFPGKKPNDWMRGHVEGELTPPARLVPEIPKALSNAIEKMMAKKQTDRYPTMTRLLEDLELILAGKVPMPGPRPTVDAEALKNLKAGKRARRR